MQMADDHDVGGMVVGWPLNMDGSAGPRYDSVRDFVHAMLRMKDWPVLLHDEELSTVSVEKAMLAADMTRQSDLNAVMHWPQHGYCNQHWT